MKKNINILILSIVLVVAMVGCSPADKNMRNLSTQTRLGNNVNDRFMNDNLTLNKRDGVGNNLDNGMTRDNVRMNNGMMRDNGMMNDNMMRNNDVNQGMMKNTPMQYDSLGNNTGLNNTNMSTSITGVNQRATAIAKRVNSLDDVKNASVIINGDTAIIGCDVTGNMDNKTNANLKQRVEAAVKVADKNIKKVSVTTDPTIYSRIKTMSTNMMNGNPAKTFTQDIQDIMRDITNIK